MTILKTTGLLLLGVALVAGAVAMQEPAAPVGRELAARYHLRQRTQRFFERSTPSGREAQQGIYQTMPRPEPQRPNCTPTVMG